MRLIRYICVALSLPLANIVWSQNSDIKQYMGQMTNNFNDYEVQQQQSFKEYRDRINADIGQAMPQFKHTAAKVIKIR